jgi:hypothetical protein
MEHLDTYLFMAYNTLVLAIAGYFVKAWIVGIGEELKAINAAMKIANGRVAKMDTSIEVIEAKCELRHQL